MYICMYVYTHTHTYHGAWQKHGCLQLIQTNIYIYIYIYIHVYMYVCIYVYVYTHTYIPWSLAEAWLAAVNPNNACTHELWEPLGPAATYACMCIYVCMYACMHGFMYVCVWVHTHTNMAFGVVWPNLCVCVSRYICMYAYTKIHTSGIYHTYQHSCTLICLHVCLCIHICVCVCVCVCVYIIMAKLTQQCPLWW